jgi:hypothetical protein
MVSSRLSTGVPVWVRVPGIIVLVLVGIVASAVLAGAAGVGGGDGPSRHAPVAPQNPEQQGPGGGGGHRPPGGGH